MDLYVYKYDKFSDNVTKPFQYCSAKLSGDASVVNTIKLNYEICKLYTITGVHS